MSTQIRSPIHLSALGETALLLECAPPVALAAQQRIWQLADLWRGQPGISEVVPGMNNLLLDYLPGFWSFETLAAALQDQWHGLQPQALTGRLLEIPVRYGGEWGPDLDAVAVHCGLSPAEVIRQHSQAEYQVYFLGFMPGFAYLAGLPAALTTPRRATPRVRVPAGAVAIGGAQTGVYPRVCPGGWQIIGQTDWVLFDAARSPPCVWAPGDRVRFVAVSA
ncbi:MAG: 5-oxoprolinase subunit PxpB [Aeromonadaceae bacterium]|nr:5-oxoprolinase subunit PxpB [Aeromonadaceae bacterium]